ncbi:MAG: hypothetical protein Q4G11_06545, partial [Gallicola sp.]|nr:hypothetical protein [Gallicola sp.]
MNKMTRNRRISFILAMITVLQIFMPLTTVSALGSILVTHTNAEATGHNATTYTTEYWNGRINIDGTPLSALVPGGIRVEISMDGEFVYEINVPRTDKMTSNPTYSTVGDQKKATVFISPVDGSTRLSFTYRFKFVDRRTPEGYTITPRIQIYQVEGNELLYDNIGITQDEPTITAQVNQPQAGKAILSVADTDRGGGHLADNRMVYGGTLNTSNTAIADLTDVPFRFTISTAEGSWAIANGGFQAWGVGQSITRLMESIVITDTLPTYEKLDGTIGTAVFDPGKNPTWIDNGDGTVSTTVTESAPNVGDAHIVMKNNAILYLQFPDAKVSPYSIGSYSGYRTPSITNNVSYALHPVNELENGIDNTHVLSDSIKFYLDDNLTKEFDGLQYTLLYNTNTRGTVQVDPVYNYGVAETVS